MIRRIFGTAVAICALAAGQERVTVSGTAVNALTGEPLPRAQVELGCTGASPPVFTDAAGRFQLTTGKGHCRLSVVRPGFEPHIALIGLQEPLVHQKLELKPLGALVGRVTDSRGDPVPGVQVELLRASVRDGRRRHWVSWSNTTNDLGTYRLAHVSPGRYVLRASGYAGRPAVTLGRSANHVGLGEAFGPVYFETGGSLRSANPIDVKLGSTIEANLTLTLVRGYAIRGKISGVTSFRKEWSVELFDTEGQVLPHKTLIAEGTGSYQISDVVPGNYVLRVSAGTQADRLVAVRDLAIGNSDLEGVDLHMLPAVQVVPAAKSGCQLFLTRTAGGWLTSAYEGRIQLVDPGSYRVEGMCRDGYVTSIASGSTDLLNNPLVVTPGASPISIEIAIGSDGGRVEGKLKGGPTGDYTVVLVPGSANHEPVATRSISGAFAFTAIRPGDYQIHAWAASSDPVYAEPEWMRANARRGVRVRVEPNTTHKIELEIEDPAP